MRGFLPAIAVIVSGDKPVNILKSPGKYDQVANAVRIAEMIAEAKNERLIATIAVCFGVEMWLAQPDPSSVAAGFVPAADVIRNGDMLYIAIGILGATVMPHNLYLHSSIVQTRRYSDTHASKAEAIRFATLDSSVALMSALFINAAILVMAAATFHGTAYESVADIGDAYRLLSPLLGTTAASVLFGIALLCSGQNATLTGTLAEALRRFAELERESRAALEADVRLVRIEDGRLEIALERSAARSLVSELSRKLEQWTGRRWTVIVSNEPGQPTLRAQAEAAKNERERAAENDPRVQEVLARLPGARVVEVVEMLRAGRDLRDTGPVLTASHASMRDDFEITVPERTKR